MAQRGVRSAAATIVGWVLVLALVFLLFGAVVGTVRVLVRFAAVVFVLLFLAWVYFRLKGDE